MILSDRRRSGKEGKWFLLAHNERNIFYIASKMHISSRGLGPRRKSIFVDGQAASRCGILRSCGADAAQVVGSAVRTTRSDLEQRRHHCGGRIEAIGIETPHRRLRHLSPPSSTSPSVTTSPASHVGAARARREKPLCHPATAPLSNPAMRLDFAQLRDHSPATCDAEGALWRRKRCSNFREW